MTTTIRSRFFILPLATALLAIPNFVNAQVVVTEIMYDVGGADTGREWIEIENTGSTDISLTTWKLFEGTTNHKITSAKGALVLASGAYAVIADNAARFLSDNPGYSGQLFDSAFSLSNAGETLIIRDAKLADMHSVSYTPSMGAGGDGNSLQRTNASATFAPGRPTPGSGDIGTAIVPPPKLAKVAASLAPKEAKSAASSRGALKQASGSMPVLADNTEEVASAPVSEAIQADTEVAAAAAASSTLLAPWLLGLAGFIAIPAVGVVALRRRSRASWSIIEDTSDTV